MWRNGLHPVAELDGAGIVVARFVYAGAINVPALIVTATGTYEIVLDRQGGVRYVVDASSGAIVQELAYDAWGRTVLDTSPGFQPFGFAGGFVDADTGLVRFGARDYDPTIGRWTTKDPIRFGGGDNFYAYADNDPVTRKDPLGLDVGEGGFSAGDDGTGGQHGSDPGTTPYSEPDYDPESEMCFDEPPCDDAGPGGSFWRRLGAAILGSLSRFSAGCGTPTSNLKYTCPKGLSGYDCRDECGLRGVQCPGMERHIDIAKGMGGLYACGKTGSQNTCYYRYQDGTTCVFRDSKNPVCGL